MFRCEAVEKQSNSKMNMEMRGSVTGNAAYKNERSKRKEEEIDLTDRPNYPVKRSKRKENEIDWTDLPNYPVMEVLSLLNLRDRASVASVRKSWRDIASSPWLWKSLDIRNHKFNPEASNSLAGCCRLNAEASNSLAGRCRELQRLKFSGGVDSVEAIIRLAATDLKELRGDLCRDLTDAALSMLAAGHRYLQHLELGQLVNITSPAIGVVASSCPNLQTLRLYGIKNVEEEAIDSLVRCCPNLRELGLWDCINIDESAVGKAASLKFLSVAGCRNIKWKTVSQFWRKMPSLVALDVSRTDFTLAALSELLKSQSLRVVSAFDCPILEMSSSGRYSNNSMESDKLVLLATFTDVLKVFHEAINYDSELKEWVEWLLSHALIWVFKSTYGQRWSWFWVEQGVPILLSFLKNSHEDVRERAAAGISTCADSANRKDANAVIDGGGIRLLMELARRYSYEGVQWEAVKAIAKVCARADFTQGVAARDQQVIIEVILGLVRSPNTSEAGMAAPALWNISDAKEYADAIVDGGGVKPLIYLLFQWRFVPYSSLAAATCALANLTHNEDFRMELGIGGGVDALAVLANSCTDVNVQMGTACCLLNLVCYGNCSIAWRFVEAGGVPGLVHISSSSFSKFARFMAITALAFIFDGRMEEEAAVSGLVIEGNTTPPSTEIIDSSRHMAIQNIQAFIHTVLDHQTSCSSQPDYFEEFAEMGRIENVEKTSWNLSVLGKFVTMAQSNSIVLGAFAVFALSQLTMPGKTFSRHHTSYLQQSGAQHVLSTIATATNTPPHTKAFSRIVLRNIGVFC